MKTLIYMSTLVVLLTCVIACSDEQNVHTPDMMEESVSADESISIVDSLDQTMKELGTTDALDQEEAATRSNTLYYYPSPNGGQCGKTSYLFYLKDYGNDPQRAVKLTLPNGNVATINLKRWNDYQYIRLNIFNCGDVFWTMVNKSNNQPLIGTYKLKNTGVSINVNGLSKLGWGFKHDGSSWQNKNGWHIVMGSEFHTGVDAHAHDWNWGYGNEDLGKVTNAPLSGIVIRAGIFDECYGKTVDILHFAGNKRVLYRITHLDEILVDPGQYVVRGDYIGTVGHSGKNTSCGYWTAHAHCVLYEVNNNNTIAKGLPFTFSYWKMTLFIEKRNILFSVLAF